MPVSSSESFCPSPPSLSLFANKSGRLDTMNTYVAEYLLRASLELDPIVFFRRYQAGFTITAQDPIVSICDCNNCTLFERLTIEMRNSSEPEDTCPVYLAEFSRKSNETLCSNQPSCFSVEPLSANFLQVCSHTCMYVCALLHCCSLSLLLPVIFLLCISLPALFKILSCNASVCGAAESRPVSKVYPEQLPTPAVTVWYSNDVRHLYSTCHMNTSQRRFKNTASVCILSTHHTSQCQLMHIIPASVFHTTSQSSNHIIPACVTWHPIAPASANVHLLVP